MESQLADEHSTVNLYRSALRLRRDHPALGRGTPGPGAPGPDALRWLSPDERGLLCFAREPASGPVAGGSMPPDTAVWLGT